MNWLERARREIHENGQPPTANSAVRSSEIQESGQMTTANNAVGNLTAVTAVPAPGFCEKHEGSEEGSFDRLPETPEAPGPSPSVSTHTTSGNVAPAPAEEMLLPGGPPSPPPAPARHKAAIVEHLQATGSEDDLPPAPAGVGGAGTDVTGSTDITAPKRPQQDGWSSEDWRAYRDERAAIAEYDGKLDRPQAEERAYKACLAEWLDQHPVSSKVDDGCVICGATDRPNDSLLPVGIGSGVERVWLHRDCVPAWRQARVTAAVAALAELGIRSPEGSSP